MAVSKAREAAFKVLYRVHEAGGYANLSLDDVLRQQNLSPEDRRLATELVNGTVRYDLRLQYVLEQYLTRGSKKIPAAVIIVLKLALYQIMFLERIPIYAVINEAVTQTAGLGFSRLKGLTNAVLREAARSIEQVSYPDRRMDLVQYLSIYYSHPRWLVERWLYNWGAEYTEKLLAFDNTTPPVTLRVNTLQTSREKLQISLAEQGVEVNSDTYTPWALHLVQGGPLTETPAFKAGEFYIQDEGSMLVAAALEPAANACIIDAGAGVGGKSTMFAQLMNDSGRITAIEMYANKIKLLRQNCQRLGINSVQPWQGDLLDYQGSRAAGVFLDAPCSGLGVLRRRSDARYRRQERDITELAALQARMLEHCSALVEPGGTLIYATCTLEAQENEHVAEAFLVSHHEYEPLDFPECWKQLSLPGVRSQGPGWLLDPTILNTDGMFVARMRRTNS